MGHSNSCFCSYLWQDRFWHQECRNTPFGILDCFFLWFKVRLLCCCDSFSFVYSLLNSHSQAGLASVIYAWVIVAAPNISCFDFESSKFYCFESRKYFLLMFPASISCFESSSTDWRRQRRNWPDRRGSPNKRTISWKSESVYHKNSPQEGHSFGSSSGSNRESLTSHHPKNQFLFHHKSQINIHQHKHV